MLQVDLYLFKNVTSPLVLAFFCVFCPYIRKYLLKLQYRYIGRCTTKFSFEWYHLCVPRRNSFRITAEKLQKICFHIFLSLHFCTWYVLAPRRRNPLDVVSSHSRSRHLKKAKKHNSTIFFINS